MEISQSQLDTLMYWAKVGVAGTWHYKKYREEFPKRKDPYIKIMNIEWQLRYGRSLYEITN